MTKTIYRDIFCAKLPILIAIVLFGCSQTAPVVVVPEINPEPENLAFVTSPLPGVDSLVISEVLEDFDSTFVRATAEVQATLKYLEGQSLITHAESLLTVAVGPSMMADFSDEAGTVDTSAFTDAVQDAREVLTAAARAQAAQDSVQAQNLLASAQKRLEEAVRLNPRHQESQYQLVQVYTIRAKFFREQEAWDEVLTILRELVQLRADEHGLWAEIAHALDQLERFPHGGVLWLRAAETVLDDARLSFDDATVDSALVFNYSVRSYRSFVNSRSGEGVYRALMQARQYAMSTEQKNFADQELVWAQWDLFNLDHRLVFDSLRQAAPDFPLEVITELGTLIPALSRPAARWEANYNHAVLSHSNGLEDSALDTLKMLWYTVRDFPLDSAQVIRSDVLDTLILATMPYAKFMEDVRLSYARVLFERALFHHQEGQSGHAFTYLMQVVETKSSYTGKAYIEALKLARYNPEQALSMEAEIEEIFDEFVLDDQLAYLREMGNLYRRIGKNDKAATFLTRFRGIRDQALN